MSLRLTVLKSLPLAYWRLNDTSGTTSADLSGNGFTLTHSGSPSLDQGPITAAGSSIQYDTTKYSSATITKLFFPGQEQANVTIVAWLRPTAPPTARRLISGRSNCGLYVSPAGIEFTVVNSGATSFTSVYPVTNWDEVKYVVASFGNGKVSVTVNLDHADSVDFSGTFASQTTTWYVGGTSTTSATTVNVAETAIYNFQLQQEAMTNQYIMGRAALTPRNVALALGGIYYGPYDQNTKKFYDYLEIGNDTFRIGTLANVTVEDDTIFANTAGTPGTRISYPVSLDGFGAVVAGSRIDWDSSASGVTVDVSYDGGSTWTACTNHATIPNITAGTNTDGVVMQFRETFTTSDLVNSPAILSRLHAVIYQDKSIQGEHGSLATTTVEPTTISEVPYLPIEARGVAGVQLVRPGALVIPAQPDDINGIGFWLRRDAAYSNGGTLNEYIIQTSAGGGYVRLNPSNVIEVSGFTTYLNGVATSLTAANLPIGRFVWVFLVPTTAVTGTITLNSDTAQTAIGKNTFDHIQLYPQALSTSLITSTYGMQVGSNTTQFVDPVVDSIVDRGFTAYVNTWALQSGGI